MTPRLLTVPFAAMFLSATACAPAAPPTTSRQAPPMSDPMPAMEMKCNPEAAKAELLGQPANEANLERARAASGAEHVRVIKPDMMVTLEFNPSRLNVDVDEAGNITNLRCG
ncbi:hypothetical protein H4F99_14160 [Lysobacter sp. SG-8]|uniref:Peptidase inhibitor I78 family protein n=1 Tax=Marilutibacter penaei TaxID=2759900 RepID=A0A7W3YFQ2_9GAMM|nr:I78 family peptidase inhibitor [Lysobacter penaei]MBB1089625.1 hypothetical protein [Lysobacter penaei]